MTAGPSTTETTTPSLRDRLLPTTITRWTRGLGWATLVSQIAIVGTGGAVRLTGSGLGCPTWPRCTADSYVAVPEMGVHGIIEFGNRMLTFVLVLVAVLTFLSVIRTRATGRGLVLPAFLVGLYIPIQAVIGGITVLTGLNPYIVGLHYLASIVIVSFAAWYVWRIYFDRRDRRSVSPRWLSVTVGAAAVATAVTLCVGVLTTGSGPHAGDSGASRNGLDAELLQHLHSYPAYALLALTIAVVAGARYIRSPLVLRWSSALLGVLIVQIVVGIAQARLGLPEILVGIHMVVACCVAAAMTATCLALRQPATVLASPYSAPPVEVAEKA
ncbi:heme A synthase [Amnibacterium flavum]|uniref:COX15/CtaA family protein n=1 Tax=Amnibacterium flavum TaxID=2173173 RepID=UPI001F0C72D2|nr:COX15/CtaA family protein [Amnibacterium flavum]